MRKLSVILVAMALLAPVARAESLPAGKPAGVQEAGLGSHTGVVLLVAGGSAIIIALAGILMGNAQSSSGTK